MSSVVVGQRMPVEQQLVLTGKKRVEIVEKGRRPQKGAAGPDYCLYTSTIFRASQFWRGFVCVPTPTTDHALTGRGRMDRESRLPASCLHVLGGPMNGPTV